MDERVRVDSDSLCSSQSEISNSVQEMCVYTKFMLDKISAVNERFNSRNYLMIVEAMNVLKEKLEPVYERMDELNKYLKALGEFIEEYDKQKY